MPHMHTLGKSLWTDHYRNGVFIGRLADVPNYDFNDQKYYLSDSTIMPGDEMQTHCVWSSPNKNVTTFGGESTSEEMCFDILLYYPKMSSGEFCVWYETQGCDCGVDGNCTSRPECNQLKSSCNKYKNCTQCGAASEGCTWCDSPYVRGCMSNVVSSYCSQIGGTANNCAGGTGTSCTAHLDCNSCNSDDANRCGWCNNHLFSNESLCLGYPVGQQAYIEPVCNILYGNQYTPSTC